MIWNGRRLGCYRPVIWISRVTTNQRPRISPSSPFGRKSITADKTHQRLSFSVTQLHPPAFASTQPKSCLKERNLSSQRRAFTITISSAEREAKTHKPTMSARSKDPNTLSNTNDFKTEHTLINLTISFKEKKLSGYVDLCLVCRIDCNVDPEAITDEVWLDSSYVNITKVEIDGNSTNRWSIEDRAEPYGSRVKIILNKKLQKDERVSVRIFGGTTKQCTALQWMEPSNTSNGKHPFMFSQCQAIHARSLFPCQDTPLVKSKYTTTIRSPLPVVVSGISTGVHDYVHDGNNEEKGTLSYTFSQAVPIPSYLYAVASGDIASASIGPRSSIYTGPEELLKCKSELEEDVEKFIQAAEDLIFPYKWTTYNVLVLPPSFPYGGMENPNMTFATPSIISGDKSNIDVIAHELAHSWSGNLVTNASWEDFWLNEGWTTYLERRINGILHGEEHFHFSAIIGWKALKESVDLFGQSHEFTKLVVNLKGKNPDDAFSSVPYEKGFNFLYFLDRTVGREKWDKFIPYYFTKYQGLSLTSQEFKQTVLEFFSSDPEVKKVLNEKVDWVEWYYSPGLPPKPDFNTTLVGQCYKLADKWISFDHDYSSFSPDKSDISLFSSGQIVAFLERLLDLEIPLKPLTIQKLNSTYCLTASPNAEILSRFYQLALKAKDSHEYEKAAEWVGTVGRMKFVRPIYRELNVCDRDLAVKTFRKYEGFYHPICREMVRKDLGL